MNDLRLPKWMYALLLASGVFGSLHYYPFLPERMASHFSAHGTPNGWQPKEGFFLIMGLVTGLTAIIGFLAPALIARLPASQINLPNKAYWLRPEHRAATMEFVAGQFAWFACALLFVILFGGYQAIQANLPDVAKFDSQAMRIVIVGFLVYVLVWVLRFVRHFAHIP
jgi:uncharacterized membrane protein